MMHDTFHTTKTVGDRRNVAKTKQKAITQLCVRSFIKQGVMACHGYGIVGDRVTSMVFRLLRLRKL